MKQVININFQGRVVPIEVSAFDLLKAYTESLGRHFAGEDGKDEIINDIESRIGELFQERLNKGATCITEDDVNAVIKSMGRPEDFETEEAGGSKTSATTSEPNFSYGSGPSSASTAQHRRLYRDEENKVLGGVCAGVANYFGIDTTLVRIIFVLSGVGFFAYILLWAFVPSSSGTVIGGVRRKLYRDGDNKIIAGVCSGIGNYFGISSWIPRALFLLPFLSFVFRWGHWGMVDFPDFLRIGFSPGALIIYIILWLVIPEAVSTAEKLEMKGEKVDLNSIKQSVKDEMKGFQERAERLGKEARTFAQDKGRVVGSEIGNVARRGGRSLGDVIVVMIKFFSYFIIGCVGLALVIALFALCVASIGVFPLKDFVISSGWEDLYAWGTLVFFIGVPVVGVLTWIIRRLAKARGNSRMIRLSFISLWVIGWVCMIFLVSNISREFSHTNRNMAEQEILLSNPKVSKLEVTCTGKLENFHRSSWLRFEPFAGVDEDTAYIKNFDIRIIKSPNDSFRVTMIRMANGRTRNEADMNASMIGFNGVQRDSIFQLDQGIAINKTNKFRNQSIVLTIYVPAGKHILIDKSIGWYNRVPFESPWNDDAWDFDNNDESHNWTSNVEYLMNADGRLFTLNGKPSVKAGYRKANRNDNSSSGANSGNDENYRYSESEPLKKIDSMRQKADKEQQLLKDSLEKVKEKIDRQLEKINGNDEEPTPSTVLSVQGLYPVLYIN